MKEISKKIVHYLMMTLFAILFAGVYAGISEPITAHADDYDVFDYEYISDENIRIIGIDDSSSDTLTIPNEINGYTVLEINEQGAYDILCYYKEVTLSSGIQFVDWAEANGDSLTEYKLEKINVDSSNPYFVSENGILYNKEKTELVICPPVYNSEEITTIPDSVHMINEKAFCNCDNLKILELPACVELIGEKAFFQCDNLRVFCIPNSVKGSKYDEEQSDYIFSQIFATQSYTSKPIIIYCVDNSPIKQYADENGFFTAQYKDFETDLQQIHNDGVFYARVLTNTTAELAYYIGSKTDVSIPNQINGYKITGIGEKAFYYNYDLKSVTLPEGVTYIEDRAFGDCINLEQAPLPNGLVNLGNYAFDFCLSLANITLPDTLRSMGTCTFAECKLTKVVIPEGMTSLGDSVFSNCYKLTDVVLPSTLKEIDKSAFYACNRLENIIIPDGVTTIGDYAFNTAFYLNEETVKLNIPKSVTSIGKNAFANTRMISDIIINNSNCTIYDSENTIYKDTVIHGYANSTAYTYAQNYSRTFEKITERSQSFGTTDSATLPSNNAIKTISSSVVSSSKNTAKTPVAGTVLKDTSKKNQYVVTSAGKTVAYKGTTNKKAKNITVPAKVKIGNITYSVTSVAAGAFKNNKTITKVTIGSNVSSIGKQAFYGCKKLKSIVINSKKLTIKSVGSKAFAKAGSSNYKKLTVKVPKSKKKVYKTLLKKKGLSSKAKIK